MEYYSRNYKDFHPSYHFVGMVSKWHLLAEFLDHMKSRYGPDMISLVQYQSDFHVAPSAETHIAYTICHGIKLAYGNLSENSIKLMALDP